MDGFQNVLYQSFKLSNKTTCTKQVNLNVTAEDFNNSNGYEYMMNNLSFTFTKKSDNWHQSKECGNGAQ